MKLFSSLRQHLSALLVDLCLGVVGTIAEVLLNESHKFEGALRLFHQLLLGVELGWLARFRLSLDHAHIAQIEDVIDHVLQYFHIRRVQLYESLQ